MSLLKTNEIQVFNGTTVTITATTAEISADLNVGADLDVTGALTLGTALAVAEGGTGATDAATARTNLDVDQAGTDNSTDVTLVTTSHDYLSVTGQAITLGPIDLAADVTGSLPYASISGTPTLGTAAAEDVGYFATAAQGSLADSAVQPGDDAADLGSGAATDGYVLTADGAGGAAWEQILAVQTNTTNTYTANQIISVSDNTNAALRITQTGTGNALVVEDDTNPDSTPVVVDASGRLLIGAPTSSTLGAYTAVSAQVFGIGVSAGGGSRIAAVRMQNNNAGSGILLVKSRSETLGSNTIVAENDIIGEISFVADDGTDLNTHGASIFAAVDGTPGANDMPGRLVFSTTADGASSPTERMRIDSSGNALIGYTSSNGSYKLQVNSQIFATSAIIATSDGRYKENITSLDGALNLVAQLNPVQFTWKEHPVHEFDRNQPTVGFIAQEVQEVLKDTPYVNSIIKANECTIEDAVYETIEISPAISEELDENGEIITPAQDAVTEQRLVSYAVTEEFLGIAEGNLIALLTKALQEANAKIDALETRIQALEV